MRILFCILVAVTAISLGCLKAPASTSTAAIKDKPIISVFTADPATISPGGNSVLKWTITGASSVSIDHGIGNVSISGSRAVTPSTSTVYVLTATNSAGSATASTEVIVSGTSFAQSPASPSTQGITTTQETPTPSTPSNPLTTAVPNISSFTASPASISSGNSSTLTWSVSNATMVSIHPGIGTVSSNGSISVTPTSTTQYVLTATNTAGSIQANAQVTVSAANQPGTRLIPVITSQTTTVYDFIAKAPGAYWGNNNSALAFPGSDGDSQGFVTVLNNVTLEDNQAYGKALETHPKWATGGQITGIYYDMEDAYTVQSNDRFYSKVGFIHGASAGDVYYVVLIQPKNSGAQVLTTINKTYSGSLQTIDVPLSAYAGKKAKILLVVEAKSPNAAQCWAVWVEPKIIR